MSPGRAHRCLCGCGRLSRCARFIPGHDGRLIGLLCTAVRTETVLVVNGHELDGRAALVDYAYKVSEAFGRRFEHILAEGKAYR